jgi:RHS repeat-associated protein
VKTHTGASTEFTFTGEDNDPNGLEYLRARYYDNATGRFMSGDPLGSGYGYAGGNPVNRVDPTGLFPLCPAPDFCFDSTVLGLPSEAPMICSEQLNACVYSGGSIYPMHVVIVPAPNLGNINGAFSNGLDSTPCIQGDFNCGGTVDTAFWSLAEGFYCAVHPGLGDCADDPGHGPIAAASAFFASHPSCLALATNVATTAIGQIPGAGAAVGAFGSGVQTGMQGTSGGAANTVANALNNAGDILSAGKLIGGPVGFLFQLPSLAINAYQCGSSL